MTQLHACAASASPWLSSTWLWQRQRCFAQAGSSGCCWRNWDIQVYLLYVCGWRSDKSRVQQSRWQQETITYCSYLCWSAVKMAISLFPLKGANRSRKLFRWTRTNVFILSTRPESSNASGRSRGSTSRNAVPGKKGANATLQSYINTEQLTRHFVLSTHNTFTWQRKNKGSRLNAGWKSDSMLLRVQEPGRVVVLLVQRSKKKT